MDECASRADSRCKKSAVNALKGTVTGYSTCSVASSNVRLRRGRVHYALLPVWLLNTKWNGKDFLFAMNGQTGKLVGDLPLDKGRYWKLFFSVAGAVAAALTVIFYVI